MTIERDTLHEILNNIVFGFTDSSFIRVYSDHTVSISAYINGKQILIEGSYFMATVCLKALREEYIIDEGKV